jgi:hypothetical protein
MDSQDRRDHAELKRIILSTATEDKRKEELKTFETKRTDRHNPRNSLPIL